MLKWPTQINFFCVFTDEFNCFGSSVAGEPGADRGADPAQEAGGAPKAHAGDTPTPETGAGDLEADPGEVLTVSP